MLAPLRLMSVDCTVTVPSLHHHFFPFFPLPLPSAAPVDVIFEVFIKSPIYLWATNQYTITICNIVA